MSGSRAAIVISLLAIGAATMGYVAGHWIRTDATAPEDGTLLPQTAFVQSGEVPPAQTLDLAGVPQQHALLDAMAAWLVEDGASALLDAVGDERFAQVVEGMVRLAARAYPSSLIDAIAGDRSGSLVQIAAEAVTEPTVAADLVAGLAGTEQTMFLLSVAENLPSDAQLVSDWLARFRQLPVYDRLAGVAVENLARRDVEGAATLLESMPAVQEHIGSDFARVLATNNPEKAIALFAHETMAKGEIAAGWAEIDPDAAIAWFAANGMLDHGNMIFVDLLTVLARTAPARAERILADYPDSDFQSYPAAVMAEYLDEDEDALRVISQYGLNKTFTMSRRAELRERIDSCPPI